MVSKSQNLWLKLFSDQTLAKFVIKIMANKIMEPKINVTKFIVNQIYRP